ERRAPAVAVVNAKGSVKATASTATSLGRTSTAQPAATAATKPSKHRTLYRGIPLASSARSATLQSNLLQLSPQLLFHALYLRFQPSAIPTAEVELGGAGDAVAVRGHGLQAATKDIEYLIELAFDDRAHRVQPVVEPALLDDLQAASDVGAH